MTRALGLGLVAVAAVLAAVLMLADRGGEPYRVEFVFRDADGLREGGDVKIAGARAGRIERVGLARGDVALVRARLFEGVGPIGADATAHVRPTGLLGETYVDVAPGDARRPAPSGSRVAVARTGTAVSFGDVLDLLDGPTRTRLQIVIAQAGAGLAGRGSDMRSLLAELPDTITQTHAVVAQLRARRRQLRELVVAGDRVLAAVRGRRDDLGALVDEAAGALGTVAARRRELGGALRRAPAALRELGATATALGQTARRLEPTARGLTRTAPALRRALAGLPGFRRQVRAVLQTATAVAPRVTRFSRRARPPLRRLRQTSDALTALAQTARPITGVLGAGGTGQLFRLVDGFAQAMGRRDGIGSLVRLGLVLTPQQTAGAPARKQRRRRAPRPLSAPAAAPAPPVTDAEPPVSAASPVKPLEQLGEAARGTVDQLLDFLLAP